MSKACYAEKEICDEEVFISQVRALVTSKQLVSGKKEFVDLVIPPVDEIYAAISAGQVSKKELITYKLILDYYEAKTAYKIQKQGADSQDYRFINKKLLPS